MPWHVCVNVNQTIRSYIHTSCRDVGGLSQKGLASRKVCRTFLYLCTFFLDLRITSFILKIQLNKKRPNRCKRLSRNGHYRRFILPINIIMIDYLWFRIRVSYIHYLKSYLPIWSVRLFWLGGEMVVRHPKDTTVGPPSW